MHYVKYIKPIFSFSRDNIMVESKSINYYETECNSCFMEIIKLDKLNKSGILLKYDNTIIFKELLHLFKKCITWIFSNIK